MRTMNKEQNNSAAETDHALNEQRSELSKLSEARRKTDALLADASAYQAQKLAEKRAARAAKKH